MFYFVKNKSTHFLFCRTWYSCCLLEVDFKDPRTQLELSRSIVGNS